MQRIRYEFAAERYPSPDLLRKSTSPLRGEVY
jgi:hypothetical protein